MIGGTMLLCAVSAIILIAVWSMERDDLPWPTSSTGLLALRRPTKREIARHAQRTERKARFESGASGASQRAYKDPTEQITNALMVGNSKKDVDVKGKTKPIKFDVREMNDIAGEIEDNGRGVKKRTDRVGF